MTKVKKNYCQSGIASVAMVLVIMSIAMLVVASKSFVTVNSEKIKRNVLRSLESYYNAESGIEDALLRITNSGYTYGASNTFNLNGGTVVTTVSQSGRVRTVVAEGKIGTAVRKVEVSLSTRNSGSGSFKYGAQIGAGGLTMRNNSKIIGNVYSAGNILAINSPEITGDAWVAGANSIQDFDSIGIGVDVHANTIKKCAIGRDAYYQNISGSTVVGTSYPASPDPPVEALPITLTQINNWKIEAETGGELAGYLLDSSEKGFLGPKKIAGDMNIINSAVLTLTGTVWVTGNVNFANNAAMQLSPLYGDASGVLIADGVITVNNNFYICGSEGFNGATCNAPTESFILVLSTNVGASAILMQNGTALRAVMYTSNGTLALENNVRVVEATAYAMTIKNNVQVIYDSGLINLQFSAGPGGTWDIRTWKEIE